MIGASDRVEELLAEFGAAKADAAWLLCDRHPCDRIAFTFVGTTDARSVTFGELAAASQRLAQALRTLSIGRGDRVASLMGKSVELVVTMLATWRLGAVYVPLFTAFGPEAIAFRLEGSGARVIVTDPDQRHKLDDDAKRTVLITGNERPARENDLLLAELVATTPSGPVERVAVGADGPLVHMFTSGTTGRPKAVVHPIAYVAAWQTYLEYSLALTTEDVFWCAADPGWAYGLYAAVTAPMAAGISSILFVDSFSVESTWRTLRDCDVTNFAAAPTVFRSLRASSHPVPSTLKLARASSAGEPLTPEVNGWARNALGLLVHDHFGQTEVGMVLGNHHHPDLSKRIKPGSMGRAGPGWSVTVLTDEGTPATPGELGQVGIDVAASPLMTFHGYQDQDPTATRFTPDGRFYLTGDIARVDPDGDFFFSARDDGLIITAGYRIGPSDIESVMAEHPAVAECCVIAAPDELRGEIVEAYVVTRPGYVGSQELVKELQELVKTRYAAHAYPRSVHFAAELPKTPSGKVQRFKLRQLRAGIV